MSQRSIAVAGCGPCGLASALLLARAGDRVVLFERFDAPRSIGSGLLLQPTGLAVLDSLGLGARARAAGARVERLHGLAGRRVVLDVHYAALRAQAADCGIGIHRDGLFRTLFDAVLAQGIEIRTRHEVCATRMEGGRRRLDFADGTASEGFDLVVDALGTRSPLAPRTGGELAWGALWATVDWPDGAELDRAALSQRYRRSSVMAGILPLGIGGGSQGHARAALFWSLKSADFARWQDRGLDPWKAELGALWPECEPFFSQVHDAGAVTHARYAHRTVARPAAERLIHLGDAWHSASPQLGQGANMALLDAYALMLGMASHREVGQALRHAVDLRRRHVRLYQALTWLFTPVYQSDSRLLPLLRDRLVGPLSQHWPATRIQAAMVAGLVGNPLAPLGLTPCAIGRAGSS